MLSSGLPKKNPAAHSSGLSSDTANPSDHALRVEAIEPARRRSETYGRFSERRRGREEWAYLKASLSSLR